MPPYGRGMNPPSPPVRLEPADQVLAQRTDEVPVRDHANVVDAARVAASLDLAEVAIDSVQVRGPQQVRPRHDLLEPFQPDEPDVPVERELDLVPVQDVEKDDLVAPEPQVPEPLHDR